MKLRLQTVFSLVAVILACNFIGTSAVSAQAPAAAVVARLKSDVAALTRFPSRVPGTPGNLARAPQLTFLQGLGIGAPDKGSLQGAAA